MPSVEAWVNRGPFCGIKAAVAICFVTEGVFCQAHQDTLKSCDTFLCGELSDRIASPQAQLTMQGPSDRGWMYCKTSAASDEMHKDSTCSRIEHRPITSHFYLKKAPPGFLEYKVRSGSTLV
jgi:hypothetical protein